MSSYVAVAGIPSGDTCSIFGLTPQEIRYLQVSVLKRFATKNSRTSGLLRVNDDSFSS